MFASDCGLLFEKSSELVAERPKDARLISVFVILESNMNGRIRPCKGGRGQSFGASCDIHKPPSGTGFMPKNC